MTFVRPASPRAAWPLLPFVLALISIGCVETPSTPGTFYLTSDPPLAPYRLTIRMDGEGGPSGRDEQFEAGDRVEVNWTTMPLPEVKWIEVNGRDCDGTFGVRAQNVTYLLLTLTDDGCSVEVLGSPPG